MVAKTIPTEVRMADGSLFRFPKGWRQAFRIKYGDNPERAIQGFRKATARHWDSRTVPTKFGWSDPWITEEERRSHEDIDAVVYGDRSGPFRNQAELGEKVMYVVLRAVLMSMAMAAGSPNRPPPEVVAIQEDGTLTVYDGRRKRTVSTLEEVLAPRGKEKASRRLAGAREKVGPLPADRPTVPGGLTKIIRQDRDDREDRLLQSSSGRARRAGRRRSRDARP